MRQAGTPPARSSDESHPPVFPLPPATLALLSFPASCTRQKPSQTTLQSRASPPRSTLVAPSSSFLSLVHRENLLRVPMVNLLQNSIGQRHSINHPSPLARGAPVREILIVGLQPAKIVGVHLRHWLRIRTEQDAVLKLREEFLGPAWLAAQL